jgi:DNA mismatch endonuclease, patch repair protein
VFVDGCFWHGCPQHASWPKNNADFWRDKIEANRARDADTNRRLEELGWTVIRVWAHDQTVAAADRIARVLFDSRRSKARPA